MSHLLALRSVIHPAPDLERAKQWYTAALGKPPYFDQPFYVGFDVGGFELGLDPDAAAHPPGAGGGLAYWRVDDMDAAWAHLIGLGATAVHAPHAIDPTLRMASLRDPFGTVIGLLEERPAS